jgi:hypothetical protein
VASVTEAAVTKSCSFIWEMYRNRRRYLAPPGPTPPLVNHMQVTSVSRGATPSVGTWARGHVRRVGVEVAAALLVRAGVLIAWRCVASAFVHAASTG